MDLQPTHSMFNDIIGNNNAVGFDEVVRQSLELSNLSAPDMSTAMNNIFEGTESRHEQENDGTVDCGFRVDKLDIDSFFPPPSPVSPDASLLGLQLDPSNYNHIQINEQECQAGDVNSLSKLYSAPGTTKDRAVTQYHDETVKNLPRADSQRPPPETNETVVRTTLEAPSNSTTCAMDKGPTLQSDFIACPDPPVNLLAQDLQTLDSLAIPTVNPLHLTPNPQTCAAINPNPFVTGNEKPDIQQLLLLLRENPHLPYKKQKVGHNKSFTGTVSNHLAIPERTTSDQQNVRAHGNAKVFEAQVEPIGSSNPLILTNPWPQVIHQQPPERIMLDTAQQMPPVPDGSRIALHPEVAAYLQPGSDTAKFSAPLTRQPDLFLNGIYSNAYLDANLGATVSVSDPMGMNVGVLNSPLAAPGSSTHIRQPQFVDTRTSHIEILHPKGLEGISPQAVRALLRSTGDDIVSKIELYWTHFHDYHITADRAGKVLKEKSVRFERRKRMGPEVTAIEKKAIRAQRNRERSQALRRYHKQRMGELEDVNRKLKTHNAVAKSLINCLLEEPQSLELVQEYFSTHECSEELLTFLRSAD